MALSQTKVVVLLWTGYFFLAFLLAAVIARHSFGRIYGDGFRMIYPIKHRERSVFFHN